VKGGGGAERSGDALPSRTLTVSNTNWESVDKVIGGRSEDWEGADFHMGIAPTFV
jgi:hypothetical protein